MGRRIPPPTLKYLYRTCPKCKDYLGVVVRDPPEPKKEVPIDAHCVVCGFKLGWSLLLGGGQIRRGNKAKDFGVKARRSDGD